MPIEIILVEIHLFKLQQIFNLNSYILLFEEDAVHILNVFLICFQLSLWKYKTFLVYLTTGTILLVHGRLHRIM